MTGGRDDGSALIGFLAGLGRARRKLALALGAFAPRPLISARGGARASGFAPAWADGRFFGLNERREGVPAAAPPPIAAGPIASAPVAAPRGPATLAPAPLAARGSPAGLHSPEARDRATRRVSDPGTSVQPVSAPASSSDERDGASFVKRRRGASEPRPDARQIGAGASPSPAPMAAARRSMLSGAAPLLALLPRARRVVDRRIAAGALPALSRMAPASLSALRVVALARALPVGARIDRFFPREDQAAAAVAGKPGSFPSTSAAESVRPYAAAAQPSFASPSPAPGAAAFPFRPPVRSASEPISAPDLSQRLPARAFPPKLSAAALENETPPLLSLSAGRDPLRQMAGIAESLREKVAADLREAKETFARAQKETPHAPAGRAPAAVTDDFARRLLARMRELMREERFRNGELR